MSEGDQTNPKDAERERIREGQLEMNGRARLSIAVVVSAATCADPGGPPSPGGLGYRVPSPPTATYRIADSTVAESRPSLRRGKTTSTTAVTLALTFERDPGGVRVTGVPEHFEVGVTGGFTMRGPSPGVGDLAGTLGLVMSRRGVVEVGSLPEMPLGYAALSPFASIAHELFPRLPDRALDPGAAWVDTVTWSSVVASLESTVTKVNTYTLVGDTVVDGRRLVSIAVVGEVASETTGQMGPVAMNTSATGSATGLVMWDTERGLPVYGQMEQEIVGTTIVEGLPLARESMTVFRRIWLER